MISDTPAEAKPSYACEIGRDTCPSPGADPVQNYMDYSEDNCLSQFTAEQRKRMTAQWNLYRANGNNPPTPSVKNPRPSVASPATPPTSIPTASNRTVTIRVLTDLLPSETGWTLKRGNTLLYTQATGTYIGPEQTYTHTFNNLSPGVYTFAITDLGKNGLCCEWGNGGFNITSGKKLLGLGGSFKASLSRTFKAV
jgi:hypothetical protein